MKTTLLFLFTCCTYFAQAQTPFHHHEIVGGVLRFPNYWGYRYHWSPQWAARATYSFCKSNDGSPSYSESHDLTLLKVGVQCNLIPQALFSPIVFSDIVVAGGARSGGFSLPPASGGSYSYNERFTGVGLGVGGGIQCVIGKRVSLTGSVQPILAFNQYSGTEERNGERKSVTQTILGLYYDNEISIGYRFL